MACRERISNANVENVRRITKFRMSSLERKIGPQLIKIFICKHVANELAASIFFINWRPN
jgi:hypothetical protein